MRIKKVVKRLIALGAGATMLGATVMGAMAADLSSFPSSFQDEGVFNGYLVVGEAAKPVDNLAMTDIATSMWYTKAAADGVITVEGDAWQVGTTADLLEINESVGPSGTEGIVDYISSDELAALADGELSSSKGAFSYEQKLYFDNFGSQGKAYFMENEDDEIGVFWKISDGDQLALYELDFVTDAESDIDASDSCALDDLEGKKLNFLGTEWTIVTAKYTLGSGGTVKLTFMGGAAEGTMLEGETKTYVVDGNEYEVSLTFVDCDEGAFVVNGEATGKLEDGETFSLADATEIGVSSILYQDYAGGVHEVSFFIGANKLYMTDNISSSSWSTTEIKVNEETIDGAIALIYGTMVTEPVSTTTDGELKIDHIRVNMTAQDDIYMASGEKLSEDTELEEPELLLTQNWDFEFHGFGDQATNDISLKKAGSDKYKLEFTSQDGNLVSLPLMNARNSNIYLGAKDGDYLAMNPANITDDDYFVLATKNTNAIAESDTVSTVLRYVSSKNSGDDVQTIKFKNLNTAESFERTFDDSCVFDISLNGRTHNFADADGGCATDNWAINLTSTDYAYDFAENVSTLSMRDASGALIRIRNVERHNVNYIWDSSLAIGNNVGLRVDVQVTDSDLADDLYPVGSAKTEILYNLSYTSTNEVRAAALTSATWTEADPDDTEVTYGYTEYGSKLYHVAPSSTPQEFILTVPEKEGNILAYITSGATATSVVGGGDLALVQVVDATKLDTEVADVSAQNLIVVGGPCVNSVAAELLGNPADCAEGFGPGKARLKMLDSGAGNLAMLVAGYSGEDTRLAGKVVAHRASELSGEEMEVAGTTWSDATLGVPTVVVAEEAEAEAEAEE